MQKTKKDMPSGMQSLMFILKMIIAVLLIVWGFVLIRNDIKRHDFIGRSPEIRDTIYLEGQGSVVGVPDVAVVNVGVRTESKTVEQAQAENTQKMNALVSAYKKLGIEDEDLKTARYNIYPQYDYIRDEGQRLRGYEVSQSLTVKIRDLDQVGDVLDIAGQSGANDVSGLAFEIDDEDDLLKEARDKAIEDVQEKAELLADQLGVKLGRIVSFSENRQGNFPQPVYLEKAVGIGGAADAAPSIQAGSEEVTVMVNVEFEIL